MTRPVLTTPVIGSTLAGRIAIALPVVLIGPIAVLGLVIAVLSDPPIGLRIAFGLLGLTLGAMCVRNVVVAVRADLMTLEIHSDHLKIDAGSLSYVAPRATTERVLLQVSRFGIQAIATVGPGQEPSYLTTSWRWRRAAPVQKVLAAHGWPSAITSTWWGNKEWHPVHPAPAPPSTCDSGTGRH